MRNRVVVTTALIAVGILTGLTPSVPAASAAAAPKPADCRTDKPAKPTKPAAKPTKPAAPSPGTSKAHVINAFPTATKPGPVPNGKDTRPHTARPTVPGASTPVKTLVLYDDDGAWGWLGELYGSATANLVSHFGAYDTMPVSSYTSGKLLDYTATVYIGSTYKESDLLPAPFLDDVLLGVRPVVWVQNNIWQLAGRTDDFTTRFGFEPWAYDTSPVAAVTYKGTSFDRYAENGGGILQLAGLDPAKATVLASAQRADGTSFPWAVRAANLTYIGENPLAYISENDRYLIFADLLTDALAPKQVDRNRAMLRLEDVGPDADPVALREIGDYLAAEHVPFSFGVYPAYRDPNGAQNGGVPESYDLADRPDVVAALKQLQADGGTMVMHGYTHQFGTLANPYDGVSANDFEFFTAHVDATDAVVLDGPVPGDSTAWARDRILQGEAAFQAACLPVPKIFEFPHYTASAADYAAAGSLFATRYERALYYKGVLSGTPIDNSKYIGQFFPYKVKDIYGATVLPEDLGNYEPVPYNQHPARLPADIIATAQRHLVLRDTVASFFYHPSFGSDALKQTVAGIKALGFQFVGADAV